MAGAISAKHSTNPVILRQTQENPRITKPPHLKVQSAAPYNFRQKPRKINRYQSQILWVQNIPPLNTA
jgi:hypothetical protein